MDRQQDIERETRSGGSNRRELRDDLRNAEERGEQERVDADARFDPCVEEQQSKRAPRVPRARGQAFRRRTEHRVADRQATQEDREDRGSRLAV